MKDVTFKQKLDKKAKYVTTFCLLLCAAVTVWLYFRSTASFLSGWFFLQSSSLILLVWIGMPKRTVVSEIGIRITCTLRLITFDSKEIDSICRIDNSSVPLFSTIGFMGYIGYYIFKPSKKIKLVLARSFDNLILIRSVDGREIVIGVPDVDKFMETAAQYGLKTI